MTSFALTVGKSKIDGKGLFTLEPIPARKKVGELTGELISIRKARQIAKLSKRIAIVEVDYKHAVYASGENDLFRYINHSCVPNTYMRIFNKHVEFYALRKIKKSEELTCDYGETHHDGKLKCSCGMPGCAAYL